MKRLLTALAIVAVLLTPSSVLAFDSGGNPGTTGPNHIEWTGQGSENVKDENCTGDTPNPGDTLFIFTTDGGSAHDAQLFVNGGSAIDPDEGHSGGSQFHFFVNLDTLDGLTAYATFVVDDPGEGAWNLVISHGCPGIPEADAPTVTKTAAGSYDNTYTWDIDKVVDPTEVITEESTVTLNYTVTVSHDDGTISNVAVSGTITVTNPNDGDVVLDSISDELSDGTPCTVDTTGGLTVGPGDTDFPYSCDLEALPEGDLTNHVEIAWSEQTVDELPLPAGTAEFDSDTIVFTGTDIDECVDVTDDMYGDLGTVCVGDDNPTIFEYSREVDVPLSGCVDYDNTATFTTNDTGTTGSDDATARVCSPFEAPLTIGYWRNHLNPLSSSCKSKDGCSKNGPWTVPLLEESICDDSCVVGELGDYFVDTQAEAKAVFDANSCGNASSNDSNAAACLAAQLLGAELNVANGANDCACDTINEAIAFLSAVGYNGPGSTVNFHDEYTRAYAIELKSALDAYNNGISCP